MQEKPSKSLAQVRVDVDYQLSIAADPDEDGEDPDEDGEDPDEDGEESANDEMD